MNVNKTSRYIFIRNLKVRRYFPPTVSTCMNNTAKIMSRLSATSVLTAGKMKMPVIGFGTWRSSEEEIETALNCALETGYRLIDTAYAYENENAIGRTLEKWFTSGKLRREELFITTKLPRPGNRPASVEKFLKKSLEALKLSYVDLYLIHNPVGFEERGDEAFPLDKDGNPVLDLKTDIVATWKAMEKQLEAGRVKSIGVSNFNADQIQRLIENCSIVPANNQIEMHVYLQEKELVQFCKDKGITVTSYSSLGNPGFQEFRGTLERPVPLKDPVVNTVAKKYNKSTAQVLLRFLLQLGVAVIPKSTNPNRIKENFEVFDFELDDEDMKCMKELDKGREGRLVGVGGIFEFMKKHPEFPFH